MPVGMDPVVCKQSLRLMQTAILFDHTHIFFRKVQTAAQRISVRADCKTDHSTLKQYLRLWNRGNQWEGKRISQHCNQIRRAYSSGSPQWHLPRSQHCLLWVLQDIEELSSQFQLLAFPQNLPNFQWTLAQTLKDARGQLLLLQNQYISGQMYFRMFLKISPCLWKTLHQVLS